MAEDSHTVLVVDDDDAVVDRYAEWLDDRYDVRTAADGADALCELEDVDVAVLERRLPTSSGDAVANEIDRRDADCMTAIVSDAEPDTDILHVSCGEYLVKPLSKSELLETVERLRQRARYDDRLAECANLAAKIGALEAAHPERELERDPEYRDLRRQLEELHDDLEDLTKQFDADDFRAAFATPDFAGESRIQRMGWL